jgi:hypothetical protein
MYILYIYTIYMYIIYNIYTSVGGQSMASWLYASLQSTERKELSDIYTRVRGWIKHRGLDPFTGDGDMSGCGELARVGKLDTPMSRI